MAMFQKTFHVSTKGHTEVIDLTPQVERIIAESGVREGIVNVSRPRLHSGGHDHSSLSQGPSRTCGAPSNRSPPATRICPQRPLGRPKRVRSSAQRAHRYGKGFPVQRRMYLGTGSKS